MRPDIVSMLNDRHKLSRVATFLRDHLVATSGSVGCTSTATPPVLSLPPNMHKPRPIPMGFVIPYFCSGDL